MYYYKKTIERNQEKVVNWFKIKICVGSIFFCLGEEFQNRLATISICANVHIYLILPRYCKMSLFTANDTNEHFTFQVDITQNAVMCWVLCIASFANHYWYEGIGSNQFKSPKKCNWLWNGQWHIYPGYEWLFLHCQDSYWMHF